MERGRGKEKGLGMGIIGIREETWGREDLQG